MKKTEVKRALGEIRNAESDFAIAESIFENRDAGRVVTIAAARLADDMAEAFGSFAIIAEAGDYKGSRALASFGAMAAELRQLQDQFEEQRRSLAVMESAERRRVELVAELQTLRSKADSLAYDIGELPARLVTGDIPAAASLIRRLPELQQAIRDADSVLGDN